jgi:fission process protein 1
MSARSFSPFNRAARIYNFIQSKMSTTPDGKSDKPDDILQTHEQGRPIVYASRFAAVMRSLSGMTRASRPLAYASEVGESFRPIFPQWLVRALYGVSWGYVFLDTGVKTYEAKDHGKEAMMYTAGDLMAWHTIASMALPAFSIHTLVKYSGLLIKKTTLSGPLRKYAPTVIGLGAIPFIIHPLDHLTDFLFDNSIRKLYKHKLVPMENHDKKH